MFFVKAISPSYAVCIPGTGSTNKSCGGLASYQCTSTNPPPNGTCCQFTYRCENNNCVPKCHQGVSTALCGNKCGGSTCAAKDGTCTSKEICGGEGGSIVTGVTGCISPSICCQFPATAPPSGGETCSGTCVTSARCHNEQGTNAGTLSCTGGTICCTNISSGAGENCVVCPMNYYYYPNVGKCVHYEHEDWQTNATWETCTIGQKCTSTGCKNFSSSFNTGLLPCGSDGKGTDGNGCPTALGSIKIDPASLVKDFFGIVLSISGGIAVLLIILSGYRLIASQGNPEKINEAKEHLTAAIIGLLFVIFSFSILRFIGVDVLGIFP